LLTADVPLWPDTVRVFYAERAAAIRSADTRKTWGYTYAQLQRRHPTKTVRAFTPDDLVAFLTQQNDPGRRWAPTTVRAYRICLQSLFGWAHATGRIDTDPTYGIATRVRVRPGRVRTPHWLTEAQVLSLLAATDGPDLVDQRDRIVLMLGIFTGLRTGEIGRLTWRHVDLPGEWLIFPGKGARPDRLAVPPQLSDALDGWQGQIITEAGPDIAQVPVAPRLHAVAAPGGHVVPPRPQGLGREGVRLIVRTRGAQIGIPALRPHDLRRTLAGTLDARGVPVQDIRLVLRHHHVATTQSYLDDNPLRVHQQMRNFTIG
jgi:integrase